MNKLKTATITLLPKHGHATRFLVHCSNGAEHRFHAHESAIFFAKQIAKNVIDETTKTCQYKRNNKNK